MANKKILGGICLLGGILLALTPMASAQNSAAQGIMHPGSVVVPASSIQRPGDAGVRAHTDFVIKVVHGMGQTPQHQASPAGGPPFSGYGYETPASIACVYHLVGTRTPGCNPNQVSVNPKRGSKTIAIVDAYYYPEAEAMSDLNIFSNQFGLPTVDSSNFSVVYADSTAPPPDPTGGWEAEEALDIEWAHAMAPQAKIVLVEAQSDADTDLFSAVDVAGQIVSNDGGGEVSMSWGGSEYVGETSDDYHFTAPGVVYIAAAGDGQGTSYPAVSPNVIAAGGTSLRRNPFHGNFKGHGVWQQTGGGPSFFEQRPDYQNAVKYAFPKIVRAYRGTPDLSFDSDPATGVWVYDSYPQAGFSGEVWYIYGGTSVAAQALAGIINAAGRFAPSTHRELQKIYNHRTITSDYHDITSGDCFFYEGLAAKSGWDYCTGVGIPIGYGGK